MTGSSTLGLTGLRITAPKGVADNTTGGSGTLASVGGVNMGLSGGSSGLGLGLGLGPSTVTATSAAATTLASGMSLHISMTAVFMCLVNCYA